jgi:tRNA(adenine34) deaminase
MRDPADTDHVMMARCLELARAATMDGEKPFGALVLHEDTVLAAAGNRAERDQDVTRHAEIVALSEAQKRRGTKDLSGCTLYSIVEPCAMCSFAIRECGIGRVVYALGSPLMGGSSKWNVLGDDGLSDSMPQVFGKPPEVTAGVMAREAEAVWREWNPVFWTFIKLRGYLAAPELATREAAPANKPSLLRRVLSYFS